MIHPYTFLACALLVLASIATILDTTTVEFALFALIVAYGLLDEATA